MKNIPAVWFIAKQTLFGAFSTRRTSRHLIGSVFGMALALIPLVVVLVVADGMIEGITNRYVETLTSHLQISPFGQPNLQNLREQAIKIKSNKKIRTIILERQGFGLAYSPNGRTGVTLRGIEDEVLRNDTGLNKYIKYIQGKPGFLSNRGAIIGEAIAKQLNLNIGDEIKILTTRHSPGKPWLPRINTLIVEGIISVGYQELDKLWVFIPLPKADEILKGREYQSIMGIKLNNPGDAKNVIETLQTQLPLEYQNITTWERKYNSMLKNHQATRIILLFVMALILIVAAFSISSSMITIVLERQHDLAILKSLGTSKLQIQLIFIFLGILAGFLGTGLGLILGLVAGLNVNHLISFLDFIIGSLIQLSSIVKGELNTESFHLLNPQFYLEQIPINLDGWTIVPIGIAGILLSTLASWFPAIRAGKLKPLEILRKV